MILKISSSNVEGTMVGVGGIEVAVGGIGVAVGGTGVAVGGTAVDGLGTGCSLLEHPVIRNIIRDKLKSR